MQIFPAALIACISEARAPKTQELAEITEKVWVEALAPNPFARPRDLARVIAHFALTGAGQRTCA